MSNSITVYSKPACVQCRATVKRLDMNGTEYEYIDITENPEAAKLVKDLGYLQAPVVIAGDTHWSGYSPDKIDALAN